jgi:hypothetical protein
MRTFVLEFRRSIAPPLLVSWREPHGAKRDPKWLPHQVTEWALARPTATGRYRTEATWDDIIGCGDQAEVTRVTRRGPLKVLVTVTDICTCNIGGR